MASIEPVPDWEPEARDEPAPYVCPVCGSDDVADVTTPVDLMPLGPCANGHVALLERQH